MRLECQNLFYCYPGTDIPVLRDLCFSLESPGFHALFGPSGVGKTSLAKIVAGLLPPSSGRILSEELQPMLYCHNQERLPGWSGVGRHLERITPPHHYALKESLVAQFGLAPVLAQRFGQLSLGQRNRINLVRYLVQDFQLLIMDESLANVDEKTRAHILVTIKNTFPKAFFLYISHNVVEVARFCQRIWVLRDGDKIPQAVGIDGRDRHELASMENSQALEKTMLEMMNAA
jgi:ABC-type multidrug transport system ATPase subunit